MPSLSPAQVRRIAKLARLRLTDEEVDRFAPQLSAILQYIEKLSEVDTDKVEATAQVTGLSNRFRTDEIRPDAPAPDSLLDCSPLPISDHQITTPSAHG